MGTPPAQGPDSAPAPAGAPRPVEHLSAHVRETGSPDERCGPLRVRRYIKEDGRSLILFQRAPGDG